MWVWSTGPPSAVGPGRGAGVRYGWKGGVGVLSVVVFDGRGRADGTHNAIAV